MNKKELLEAIEQKRQEIWPTDTGEMKPATVPNNLESGWLNALYWMENLINSLPAEQPSEDLKKAAKEYASMSQIAYKGIHCTYVDDQHAFIAGADWQKEQMMKSAIDGCYIIHNRYNKENVLNSIKVMCNAIQNFKHGDKVKVIIVKEDKQ